MKVKVKICGITTGEAAKTAKEAGAEYLGFIFYPRSPRNIAPKQACVLAKGVEGSNTVAVMVNPKDEDINALLKEFTPDFLQLHGNESPERIKEIKKLFSLSIIKALPVRSSDDVAIASRYSEVANMLLFDAKIPEAPLPGGNGLRFDWNLLKNREFGLPWMLSGGLNAENVVEAVAITGAGIVDVSSSLEIEPGKKEPRLIREFLTAVKRIE